MKRAGKRHGRLEPLGLILQDGNKLRVPSFVGTSPIASRDWEAAVGTRIAARARPIRLERGTLVIRTATSTWAQELTLLADTIIAQLRQRGLKVDSLRFRIGHVDAPERPPTRDEVRASPKEVPLPHDLQKEIDRVEDLALKEAIARAAAKNLGWQAMLEGKTKKKRPAAEAPEREVSPRAPPARPAPRAEGKAPSAATTEGRRPSAPTTEGTEGRRPSAPTTEGTEGRRPSAATSTPSTARAPRSVASKSAPPVRRTKPSRADR